MTAIKNVLIVDDHILFREGLVNLLEAHPEYTVIGQAGSVKEAVESALKLKPDLILMDFYLTDGTGLEATQAILARLPDCNIVYLTVEENDETLFNALRSGAKGYILKGVSISSLLDSLGMITRGEFALSPTMTTRLVKEFARSENHQPPGENGQSLTGLLTPRELEVLRGLVKGQSNQELSQALFLSENTVKNHIHKILKKLNLKNRSAAAEYARMNGIR